MPEEIMAYCVKEKAKRPIKDAHEVVFANGKHAIQGVCPTCGTKLTRFLSDKEVAASGQKPAAKK